LHRDVDGMFAQHHSRVTSEKVSLNIKNQRSRGFCTSKAPVGYLNTGTVEHKPLDPIRSPVIKQLFEKYATENWSLADLARWANAHGMTMPPTRRRRTAEELLMEEVEDTQVEIEAICRPLRANNVYAILRNPFYTGRIKGNGKNLIPSNSHTALVSVELFETVQRQLHKKNTSIHYTKKLVSPYRGFVRCLHCTRTYTPYTQKGIMYYGCRCRTGCNNKSKNFNISFLEGEVGEILKRLSFTDVELAELNTRTEADDGRMEENRNSEVERIERKRRKSQEDLTYLQVNKLALLRTGVYTPESYLEEEMRLGKEVIQFESEIQSSGISMQEVASDIKELSELFKDLYLTYEKANSTEKEEVIRKLISELLYCENTLAIKCRNGLEVLESRLVVDCAHTSWISELVNNHKSIQQSIREIRLIVNKPKPP